MNSQANLKFTSVSDLAQHFKEEYEGKFLTLEADAPGGEKVEIQVPRYLFIGEPDKTKRIETLHYAVEKAIPNNLLKEIQKTTSLVESRLRQFLQTTPTISTAYLGYYGFLSDFLYLTPSIDTAIHSIFGKYVSNGFGSTEAIVTCIDISDLINNSLIIDLTDHDKASLTRDFNIRAFHNPQFLQNLNKGFYNVDEVESFQLSFKPADLQEYAEAFQSTLSQAPDPIALFLWNTMLSLGYKMSDSSARFFADNKNLPLYAFKKELLDGKEHLSAKFAENADEMRDILYRKLSVLYTY